MEGFASYRQRTTVDFRDSDFFVLVGPTGSGKSTVIDAMIFALYGTVPRWGERNAVAPALAPTVSRGTVQLVFDAGGQRYIAARDVRRSKSGGVSVKEARLERFADSAAEGVVEDETTSLAVGREVSPAVAELLGLTFEQFTKSVALPQGEFAQFLHATGAERQAILKSLLGYRIYDDIMRNAGSQATNEESRVKVFEEQLTGYADATADAVTEAQGELDALLSLQKHVTDVAVPALQASIGQARDARGRAEQLAAEREVLTGVEMPSNIAELDAETAIRTDALSSARTEATRIEELETTARTALQQATPRHELERAITNWQALKGLECDLPELTAQTSIAAAALEAAAAALADADSEADRARAASMEASNLAEQQERELAEVHARLSTVESLRAPGGLDELQERLSAANDALAQSKSIADSAEVAQAEASAALEGTPDSEALSDAGAALDDVRAALVEDLDGTAEGEEETAKAAKARNKATAAREVVAAAERAVRDAEHADLAVTLRADIRVGDDCPVCGRTVKNLPEQHESGRLDEARERLESARVDNQEAEQKVTRLDAVCARSVTLRGVRMSRCESARVRIVERAAALGLALGALTSALDTETDTSQLKSAREIATAQLAVIRGMQGMRAELEQRRRAADSAVDTARGRLREAEANGAALQTQASHARSALGIARDAVSSLNPPSLDDTDVAAAWNTLLDWAAMQLDALRELQTSSGSTADEARKAATDRVYDLTQATTAAAAARDAALAATAAKTEADTRLDNAAAQQATLTQELAGSPDLERAQQLLGEVIATQTRLNELSTELTAARSAVEAAAKALAGNELALSVGWQELRTLRDPLSRFEAPQLSELSLTTAWRQLEEWAVAEAAARATKIDAEQSLAAEADTRVTKALGALVTALAALDVAVTEQLNADELATAAPVAVAGAVAKATAERERVQERVNESSQLLIKLEKAQEDASVARKLSQLMRANEFPQWLIASAIDTLLEEASHILMEISGGQFELRRDEGDLEVIDHNDADMPRPVKTLSGGETFQASLALALALSSQVTALSASGGKTLESILLDEGFGTLDENTLDIVASTLENLASTGSRLVGVITHVAGLAERIPMRFSVHRDALGSHIQRETA
ncbi:AAA family ATPase [Mycolicibacterium sp. Dal123E01]|uniref:AAA family ATPase n=1 Tax=Mycolicibacterium sp. Dal123E01 TaxID=3457578 RepID=UPI00403E55DD